MADLRISEMAAAASVSNADIMPIVQGGANFSASRSQLLTAAGEALTIQGDVFFGVGMFADVIDENLVAIIPGQGTIMSSSLSCSVQDHLRENFVDVVLGAGITVQVKDGHPFLVTNQGGTSTFAVSDNAGESEWISPLPPRITYIETDLTIWLNPQPVDFFSAIQRLSRALRGLLGAPIP
jgi:hypothetical protein